MAHDVFISYSSRDKPIADAICAGLEAARIRCWIAPRDVLPGMPYAESLSNSLRESQILLLVLSANSNHSGQVMREVESAVDKGITILPFRIEDVQPSASLDFFVKAIHWLDAITPPLEMHLQSLVGVIQALLTRQGGGIASPVLPDATDSAPTPPSYSPRPEEQRKSPVSEEARRQGDAAAFWFLLAGISCLVVLTGLLAFSCGVFSKLSPHEKSFFVLANIGMFLIHGLAVACHFLAIGSLKNFRGKGKVIAAIIFAFVMGLTHSYITFEAFRFQLQRTYSERVSVSGEVMLFLGLLVPMFTFPVNFIAAIRGILVLKSSAVHEEFRRPEKTRPEPRPVFSTKLVIGLASGLLSWFLVNFLLAFFSP